MKKYTIKEFAEGKKAVKIENEEQWNKLNKVHKLCTLSSREIGHYFNNTHEWCEKDWYVRNDWEVLEFSQLDFEDEFVAGSWYKYNGWFLKFQTVIKGNIFIASETIDPNGIYENRENEGFTCGDADKTKVLLTDLSEIQPFLPLGHPDFIKKETFVLPEKWVIKVTPENKAIVNEWKIKQEWKKSLFDCDYPYVSHDGCGTSEYFINSKTLITFEEFQQYVLKTEKTMEKEVIGYKLVKQEYKEVAMKITNCSDEIVWDNNLKSHGYLFSQGSVHSDKLKEAGVLDLWFEPVYASQIQLPTIDGYRGYYENGIIKYGCAKFSKMFFEHLNSTNSHLGNRTIKSIKLSSDVEISIEEIKQIVEYINKK